MSLRGVTPFGDCGRGLDQRPPQHAGVREQPAKAGHISGEGRCGGCGKVHGCDHGRRHGGCDGAPYDSWCAVHGRGLSSDAGHVHQLDERDDPVLGELHRGVAGRWCCGQRVHGPDGYGRSGRQPRPPRAHASGRPVRSGVRGLAGRRVSFRHPHERGGRPDACCAGAQP